jgi:hypothetical protein
MDRLAHTRTGRYVIHTTGKAACCNAGTDACKAVVGRLSGVLKFNIQLRFTWM